MNIATTTTLTDTPTRKAIDAKEKTRSQWLRGSDCANRTIKFSITIKNSTPLTIDMLKFDHDAIDNATNQQKINSSVAKVIAAPAHARCANEGKLSPYATG